MSAATVMQYASAPPGFAAQYRSHFHEAPVAYARPEYTAYGGYQVHARAVPVHQTPVLQRQEQRLPHADSQAPPELRFLTPGSIVAVTTALAGLTMKGLLLEVDPAAGSVRIQTARFGTAITLSNVQNVKVLYSARDMEAKAAAPSSKLKVATQHDVGEAPSSPSSPSSTLSAHAGEWSPSNQSASSEKLVASPVPTYATVAAPSVPAPKRAMTGSPDSVVSVASTLSRASSASSGSKGSKGKKKLPDVCKYFNTPKGCTRGASCRYQHVKV